MKQPWFNHSLHPAFRKSEGLPPAQEPVKRTTRRGMVGPPKIATSAPEPAPELAPPTMKQDIAAAGVETGANFMQRLLARITGGRVSGSITSDASAPIGQQVKTAGKNILDTIVLGRRKVGQAGAAATGVKPTVLLDALGNIPDPTKVPEMIGEQVGTAVQQHLSRKAQELLQGRHANQHLDPLQLILNHGESEDIVGSHSLLSYKVYNPKSKRTGTLISGPHGHTLYDPRKLGDGSVWSSVDYPVEQMSEHMKRSDAKSLQGASPWSQVMNGSPLDDPRDGVGTDVAGLAGMDAFKETPMITRSLTRSNSRENAGALGEDGVPMGGIKIMWDDGGSDHDPYDDSIGPYALPDRTPQTVRESRKEADGSGVDPEIRTHDGGRGRIPHPILQLHPISAEQQLTSTIQDLEDIAHGNHGKALEMLGAPAWLKKISLALSQRSLVPLVGNNPLTQMLTNVIKRRIKSLQVTTKMNELVTTKRMDDYRKQTAKRKEIEKAQEIVERKAREAAWKQQLAGIVRKMGSMNLAERHEVASSMYPQQLPERVRLPDDYDSLSAEQAKEIRAGQRQRQAEAAAAIEPQNAMMRDRQRTAIYEPYERSVNPFPLQLRLVKGT